MFEERPLPTAVPVTSPRRHVTVVLLTALALLASVQLWSGKPASADTAPPNPSTPLTVSSDVLPTVQVNGIVWAQLIVGNRVYVTGEFTSARPAGSPPGTNETPRSHILAYDLSTGALIGSWAPALNAQGLALAASSDGTKIFVGGDFTQISGVNRYRIAALDATSGAVLNTFTPGMNARVRVLAVSGGTIYAGGIFTTAGNQPRERLAAFSTTDGAVLPWAPVANDEVMALTVPPGVGNIVVGGRFTLLNGESNYGLGALDTVTGGTRPFAANQVVRNAGDNTAINSLLTAGGVVYGSGYTFGSGGNLESAFAADAATGALSWVSGCRGDTYSTSVVGNVLYLVGHPHDCGQLGSFPQTNPWTFQRAIAMTTTSDGRTNIGGNFTGRPAPAMLHWLPTLAVGTYSGQSQAAWSVAGNGQYVILGGEFPSVNGVAQQGLARFAVRETAPNRDGPQGYSTLAPTVTGIAPGSARLSWTSAWDRDNERLTYEVLRGPQLSTATVISTMALDSAWFRRPMMGFTDTTAPPGTNQSYRIRVKDPHGNTMISTTTVGAVPAGTPPSSAYRDRVRSDGAIDHWRLGETSGPAYDWAGGTDLTLSAATVRNSAGAIGGDPNRAVTFSGLDTVPASTGGPSQTSPQAFSTEAWFKTSTSRGGKIIGFGNNAGSNSTTFDRHVYMTNSGQLVFGVSSGTVRTVASPSSYNDGRWHHVVAAFDTGGPRLYVDGALVASRTDTLAAASYLGWWRVGGDALSSSWPSRPGSNSFAGSVDEVAVYPRALPASAVEAHWQLGNGVVPNQPPTASFTATASELTASVDAGGSSDVDGTIASYRWDFGDGATGTGATATHPYASGGTYTLTLTVTDDDGATGTATRTVTVTDPPPPNQAPAASFTASATDRTVSVDASGSTDADGTIVSYAWDFGDNATGTGATATHSYATAGTYTVTLTVTDDDGATSTTTRTVTANDPPVGATIASDTFERTVASGLGTAETGGSWTAAGAGTTTSVTDGSARIAAGIGRTATVRLPSVSNQDTDLVHKVWLDQQPTGGGVYLSSIVRSTAAGDYRSRLRIQANGQILFNLAKVVGTTETALTTQVTLTGITYTAGTKLLIRTQALGANPTTLRAKVWVAGTAEPTTWRQSITDTTAGLQEAGSLGLVDYVSGSATAAAVIRYDDLVGTKL